MYIAPIVFCIPLIAASVPLWITVMLCLGFFRKLKTPLPLWTKAAATTIAELLVLFIVFLLFEVIL